MPEMQNRQSASAGESRAAGGAPVGDAAGGGNKKRWHVDRRLSAPLRGLDGGGKFWPDAPEVIGEQFLACCHLLFFGNYGDPNQLVIRYSVIRLPLGDRGRFDAGHLGDGERTTKFFNQFNSCHVRIIRRTLPHVNRRTYFYLN